jgi:hypothetical protein
MLVAGSRSEDRGPAINLNEEAMPAKHLDVVPGGHGDQRAYFSHSLIRGWSGAAQHHVVSLPYLPRGE